MNHSVTKKNPVVFFMGVDYLARDYFSTLIVDNRTALIYLALVLVKLSLGSMKVEKLFFFF